MLKRAYQIYRHDYPFQSSLPIQGDPFIATDGLKATVREYQFQAYALALGDSSDVDRVVKKYHESVTGATGVAPLADADKVDMKKKVVTTAGARSQFVNKVEGARLEQSDELAGETANFAENVVHVLGACGTIFSQTCAHHDKLVSWMSATDGPFRAALGFGDLSWLGASLYAPAGYARAYFLPAGNTGDVEFFPLGCTRELPLSGLLHVPQLHESLQPQNNKPPELHQDPTAQVMTHGGEADPDIKLDKRVIKADDDLELELRKLKLKEHQARIEQMSVSGQLASITMTFDWDHRCTSAHSTPPFLDGAPIAFFFRPLRSPGTTPWGTGSRSLFPCALSHFSLLTRPAWFPIHTHESSDHVVRCCSVPSAIPPLSNLRSATTSHGNWTLPCGHRTPRRVPF